MVNIKFKTDNAAFEYETFEFEVSRILRELAEAVEKGLEFGTIRDNNGNEIGTFDFKR